MVVFGPYSHAPAVGNNQQSSGAVGALTLLETMTFSIVVELGGASGGQWSFQLQINGTVIWAFSRQVQSGQIAQPFLGVVNFGNKGYLLKPTDVLTLITTNQAGGTVVIQDQIVLYGRQ